MIENEKQYFWVKNCENSMPMVVCDEDDKEYTKTYVALFLSESDAVLASKVLRKILKKQDNTKIEIMEFNKKLHFFEDTKIVTINELNELNDFIDKTDF